MPEPKRRSEAKEADEKKQRYLDRHFREVFGVEGERTQSQQIVWENFMANLNQNVFRPGAGPNGYDPIDAALADGGRRLILQIKTRVERKWSEEGQQKPEVKK